ncbi:MAG: BTAD domain-containing putative transcriptional regulator [Micropruina sp.]|uniref:AfsR/SARP family transcriptional regulator n=1 Tax=Micropruina sp. TaxID=2737536 RepID=UPI0039E508DE
MVVTPAATTRVTGPLQVALLSLLAVRPGRVLRSDELIDRLWPSGGPPSAPTALRVHLTRLRAMLSAPAAVSFTGRGYALDPALVDTDAMVFESLTADLADGDAEDRLRRCEEALALWRDRPFAGLDDDELTSAAQRLDQRRLATEEARSQALLDLGRHAQAAADLIVLVRAEPLREQRTAQLMLAHYRAGRQADALQAYRALRDRLAGELGVDPGQELRRLELRILRQDAELGEAAPGAPARLDLRPPRTVRVLSKPAEAMHDLADERLRDLPEDAATLVRLLAVLGEPVARAKVAGSLSLPPSRLDRLLQLGARAGLLTRSASDEVSFVRPELADAVVWSLTPALRRRLHGTAGQLLAWHCDEPADLVGAAWHLVASGSIGRTDRWSLLHRALDLAARVGADGVVESLAGAALDAAPDEGQTIDLRIALARSLAAQGRPAEATRVWQVAVAEARATGNPTRFALVVLARNWQRRSVDGSAELCALLTEALERLGPGSSAVRVSVQGSLLLEAVLLGRPGILLENDLDQLQSDAAAIGDPESLATVFNARHVLMRGTAAQAARRGWAAQLSATVTDVGDPWWRARALVARIFDCYTAADLAEVESLCKRLKREASHAVSHRMLWHHHLTMASLQRDRGNVSEADRWAEEAMLHGAARGIGDARPAMVLHRLQVAFQLGGVARFLPEIDAFLASRPDELVALGLRSLALAQTGDAEGASAAARRALSQVDIATADEGVGMTLGVLAEASTADAVLASQVHTRLLGYTGQFLVFGQISASFGPADRFLALAARTMGDHAAARRFLAAAHAQSVVAGADAWVANCAALSRAEARA